MSALIFSDGGLLSRFLKSESGATAIEYALIAGGVTLAIIAAVYATGDALVPAYEAANAGLE
jgi:pilus assembly protein Flp/PilA